MENENERIYTDALSMKLFDKNVNPHPSQAWFMISTEEEISEWQHGDKYLENMLMDRIRVQEKVEKFTYEDYEELAGIRHYVPELEEDYEEFRNVSIVQFTLQETRKMAGKHFTRCIFHNDQHPSCVLYENNGYNCFSCGAVGNSIDWAMEEFGFTFRQAVEFLRKYL